MSINSQMSQMSVSYNGSEVPLEAALDDCFKRLQASLNNTHMDTRALAMVAEQDADWTTACQYQVNITQYIDEMMMLFKELKKVVVQVRGKPANEEEKLILKQLQERE